MKDYATCANPRYAMIEDIVNHTLENMKNEQIKSILMYGFSGYAKYTDNQLLELIKQIEK